MDKGYYWIYYHHPKAQKKVAIHNKNGQGLLHKAVIDDIILAKGRNPQ